MAYSVGFWCGVDIENAFWFPSIVGNALLCRENGRTRYIGKFPNEIYNADPLYSGVILYKEQLIFIPMDACNIAIYDLKDNMFKTIPWRSRYGGKRVSIAITIRKDEKLFLFPHNYNCIIKIDLSTWKIEEKYGILDEISKYIVCHEDNCFGYGESNYAQFENSIYIGIEKAHAILEFNLESEKYIIHDLGNHGYSATVRVMDKIWLAPRKDGCVIVWDPIDGKVQQFTGFPEGFKSMSYIGGFHYGDYVWFLPVGTNMVLKINIYSGKMEEAKIFSRMCNAYFSQASISRILFLFIKKMENKYFICAGKKSALLMYSPDVDEIQSDWWECPEEYRVEYIKELKKHFVYCRMHLKIETIPQFTDENSSYTLEDFLWDI